MAKTKVWQQRIKGYKAVAYRLHHQAENAFVFEIDGLPDEEEYPSLPVAVQQAKRAINSLEEIFG